LWRRLKSRFTHHVIASGEPVARNAKGEYALWQRRFWEHTIRDEDDFARHVDYIHINPVKHGLVQNVCDWPWSSFHRYVRLGVLPQAWGGGCDDANGFGEREG
jgi:putative transposase